MKISKNSEEQLNKLFNFTSINGVTAFDALVMISDVMHINLKVQEEQYSLLAYGNKKNIIPKVTGKVASITEAVEIMIDHLKDQDIKVPEKTYKPLFVPNYLTHIAAASCKPVAAEVEGKIIEIKPLPLSMDIETNVIEFCTPDYSTKFYSYDSIIDYLEAIGCNLQVEFFGTSITFNHDVYTLSLVNKSTVYCKVESNPIIHSINALLTELENIAV